MNSRSQPDRSQLLRSKHEEIQGIVKSRKRKLREFWAICESTEPVPNFIFQSPDASPINDEEQRFLELSDILKGKLFNESNLPTRRNLRSDISKRRSPIRKTTPDGRSTDISRNAAKIQRDGSRPRKSRAPTPSSKSDVGHEGASRAEAPAGQGLPLQRSASKGSQTDLPPESAAVLNEIIEETFESATQPRADIPNEPVPPGQLERDRVEQLESRPNSPGVDPRKAMPILAEDAARLKEPLINGLGSHDGPPHKALTVHLPPKKVQERHAKEPHQIKSHPSSNVPPPDGVRAPDHLSSPGSTSAHSATTPGLHEASTDTSPDHESRYNVERPEKEDRPRTPTESKNTPEALREDGEAQQLGRPDNLQSSPITAEAQLRSEGQAASQRPFTSTESEEGSAVNSSIDQTSSSCLTNTADEVVEEAVEATLEDKVGAACTPKPPKETVLSEPSTSQRTNGKDEIVDSEAGDTPSADAMDIDSTPVQKFSAGRASVEIADRTPVSPKAPQLAVLDQPKKSPTSATPTPRRESVTATPVPERMTTRVSSGAMRHKSVSEILGESPRLATVQNSERNNSDRNGHRTQSESAGLSDSHSRVTTAHSPITRKSLIQKSKDKDRSMLSTVVFAKQTLRQNDSAKLLGGNDPIKDDYFKPLFLSAAMSPARGYSALDTLLGKAHKTISTNNAYVPILENQTIKVLKRIFDLQKNDRWSLRQPKRSEEPQRPSSHWDIVLQEAKWMRTDFREERKWKMMVAKNLAFACAEWHSASPGDRKKIQINAVPPPPKDTEMTETANQEQGVPELVSSTEVNSPMDEDEEPQLDLPETVSPYAIFGLQDDDVVFGLRNSPISHRLLEELPMYCAPLCVPSTELSAGELDPERFWKRKALPISRYVEGEMKLKKGSPPRKKSRYQYEEESDDDELTTFGDISQKRPVLPPEKNDVALFNPEHKHIRDRIHAGHQFRPPSEYPMPLQSFFENRQSSQWTLQEDDDLRRYVREYSYNWSFISNMLQTKSLFSSGPERRTPWECFERWVSLEGLPGDMQKTQYFRLYTQRVETANRNVLALASQPQQPNPNGQIQPPRRRTTSSIRVERRRNQKHLTIVDAMRKLAKKRENTIQKQQQAAGLAASRKPPELTAHRNASRTPAEFSRLKFEQQEKLKQSILLQQQQQHQQRLFLHQQRLAAQNTQQPGAQGGQQPLRPPQPNGVPLPNGVNGTPSTSNQNLQVPGQARPRGPMPPQMNGQAMGNLRPPQPLMNGVPQAQMQGIQGQMPLPNPALDVGLVTQAHSIQQQQRQQIMRQQNGHLAGPGQVQNSPPRANTSAMSPPPGFPQMPNGPMMPFPNANGSVSSPGAGQSPQGQLASPRLGQAQQVAQQHNLIAMKLRNEFPNATPEQLNILLREEVSKQMQQHQQQLAQSAMNAAAGSGVGPRNGVINGMNGRLPNGDASPQNAQMYAQMLRQQQQNQQKSQQQAAVQQANAGHQRTPSGNSAK